jgi:cobalt-zinc-cadmium efflux system protein
VGIDIAEVHREMMTVRGVQGGVHDLHVWTVTSSLVARSSHVECSRDRSWNDVLVNLAARLHERFGIAHVTLQPEMGNLPAALSQCTPDTPGGRIARLSHRGTLNHETAAEHARAT